MRPGITIILMILGSIFSAGFAVDGQGPENVSWFLNFFDKEKKTSDVLVQQAENALARAKKDDDAAALAHSYKVLGLINLTRIDDYEKAMDYFIQSLTIEDSLNLRDRQVFTYLAISRTFEQIGDYSKCSQFLEQAMTLNEQDKDTLVLVLILNEMGEINAAQGRIDAAFENYELVLEYTERLDQPETEAAALFNLGHLYMIQGKYSEALASHKKALALRRSIKDKFGEAESLNDIGELYRLMKNDERAFANHKVALEIRQTLPDKEGLAESYNNIGVLYFQQKNYDRAIDNLQLGLQAAREAHAQNQMRKSFDFLSQCYEGLDSLDQAIRYKNELVNIMEFIFRENSERQILETQNKYIVEKREAQINQLESVRKQRDAQLADQRNYIRWLTLIIIMGVIFIGIIVFLYLKMMRTNKSLQLANDQIEHQNTALQDLNATKDKFFSIISHDLRGPLNSLSSFSTLLINHAESLSKEEIQMLAKDLDKNLKNLFALLENLLEWSRSQIGGADFTPEEFDLNVVLKENADLLQHQAENKNITIVSDDEKPLPSKAHKNSINTVVRNLISNAIKFTPEGGTITLDTQRHNGEVVVSVADTGVGMSEEVVKKLFRLDAKHSTIGTANEKGTGLGLILCKDFVEKNGGRIWVESEAGKGSTFYFTVPSNN